MMCVLLKISIMVISITGYCDAHGFGENNFNKTNTTDIICPSGLASMTTVRSRLDCSDKCGKIQICTGFFFNSLSKDCQITDADEATFSVPSHSCYVSNRTKYYLKVRSNHGDACLGDEDCIGLNVLCWSGTCKCTPGYSLHPDSYTCQAGCEVYGTTFTQYVGQTLALAGSTEYANVTLQLCLNSSIADGSRTARYHYPSLSCRTDTRTPHTDPGCLTPFADIDLFVRNCESGS